MFFKLLMSALCFLKKMQPLAVFFVLLSDVTWFWS